MNVYYTVFIITFLIQFFPVRTKKEYKIRLFFTFLPMFLYGALRLDFGLDYDSYELFYNSTHGYKFVLDIYERMEFGYVYLNKISPSFRLLLIITTALICISYYFLFYKTVSPKHTWLAVFLLFLSGDMTVFFMFDGIRNAISISVLILAITFIRDRKLLYFVLMLIIATLFHTSSVIFLPLAYAIATNKLLSKRELTVWLMVLFTLLVVPFDYIVNNSMPIVNVYFGKYNTYMAKSVELGDKRSVLIISSVVIMAGLIFAFMKTVKLNKMDNIIFRLALLFVYSFLLGSLNIRVSQYFLPFFIVASTNLFFKWKSKEYKWAYLIFIILFLGYSFILYFNKTNFPFKEYHSIFNLS